MNKLLKLIIVPAVFLSMSGMVSAAEATLLEASEEPPEKIFRMEEVVVTATKTPEKRKDIPNAIIIINKTDVQISGAKTVGELLSNELGIDWRTRGNYGGAKGEIQIRGMESEGTQVFVNGVNINSPSLGSADVSRIPLNSIERIEIVKGSGSLLYGSGAMAGTVNIITKRPQRDKIDLKAEAGYGSQNTYRLSAEQGMFVAGDFGYYLTAGRLETDGFRDNSYLRHNDVSLKLILDKRETMDISLYGDFIDRTFGLPGVKPPAGTQSYYRGGEIFYNSNAASLLNHGGDRDGHIVLEIKGKPAPWIGYNFKAHHTNMESYNYERYSLSGKGKENWVTNRISGMDGHLDIHAGEGATLLVGGEYKYFGWKTEGQNLDAAGLPTSEDTAGAHLSTSGIFAEAQYRPSKYWKALAGFRREENSMFGSANLPLLGLMLNPLTETTFKINSGRHFLAPTLNQLFWPADEMGRGNPDLKPETGWHTDVTLEQSMMKKKIFLTTSLFYWNIDDKIQWERDTSGVSTPINLDGYKASGVEAGIRIGPFYDLTLALNYTYTDAEEKSRAYTRQNYVTPDIRYELVSRRAAYTPEHQFKGNLTYRNASGLGVTATARYTGDRLMYQTEKISAGGVDTKTVTYELGSYWTVDLKIEQRLYKHWIISLSGNNLLNADYDTYLATFTDRNKLASDPQRTTMCAYPGSGRSIFAGLAYEF